MKSNLSKITNNEYKQYKYFIIGKRRVNGFWAKSKEEMESEVRRLKNMHEAVYVFTLDEVDVCSIKQELARLYVYMNNSRSTIDIQTFDKIIQNKKFNPDVLREIAGRMKAELITKLFQLTGILELEDIIQIEKLASSLGKKTKTRKHKRNNYEAAINSKIFSTDRHELGTVVTYMPEKAIKVS